MKHRTELIARRRKDGETLSQYASELRRIGKLAYPKQERQNREDFLINLFMRGQGSDAFREHTLTQEMGSLAEAVQTAERHEAGMRDISQGHHASKPKVRFNDSSPSTDLPKPAIRATTNGREPATYTVSQMTDIMKLMSIATPSPSTPEAKSWRGRDKSPAPVKPWRSRGETPSPYKRETDRR